MPAIAHSLLIGAPPAYVLAAVREPLGLNAWWTQSARGEPAPGATYELGFGPGYDKHQFALQMLRADDDWVGTTVSFRVEPHVLGTRLHFEHTGWQETRAHFITSNTCWSLYLRLLRRYIEHGEIVPYDDRLNA